MWEFSSALIFLSMKFIFFFLILILFCFVYSVFYLMVFFEVMSLVSSGYFCFYLGGGYLLFYVFLGVLVIEAVMNFTLLVIFSRSGGEDLFSF